MTEILPTDGEPDPFTPPDPEPQPEPAQPQVPEPVTAPKSKVSISSAMNQLQDEIRTTLTQMGADVQESGAQLQKFLNTIQPDIAVALEVGDLLSLNYLRDRASMELGRASLGLINKERLAVVNTLNTVMRILIKIGLGAL